MPEELKKDIEYIRQAIESKHGSKVIYLGFGGSFKIQPGGFRGWIIGVRNITNTFDVDSIGAANVCGGKFRDIAYFADAKSNIAKLNGHHPINVISRKLSL